MKVDKVETCVIFRKAFFYVVESQKRGFQARIAEKTGLTSSQIGDILSGRRKGSEDNRKDIVMAMEDYASLGYTYDDMLNLGQWILDGKNGEDWVKPVMGRGEGSIAAVTGSATGITKAPPPEPSNISIDSSPGIRHNIPLISWVQAGGWHEAEDPLEPGQAEEWLTTSATSTPSAFALTVRGDSMEPEFVENDIITVDPGRFPANGNFIIAKNGDEATFKQLVLDGSNVFLKPLNNRYPIKDMTGIDFKIIGVVVEKRKRYC